MEPTGPVAADVTDVTGKLVVWAEYDFARTTFQRQREIRKSVEILFKECPGEIAPIIVADAAAADIAKLARAEGWAHRVSDCKALKKMGAGANGTYFGCLPGAGP